MSAVCVLANLTLSHVLSVLSNSNSTSAADSSSLLLALLPFDLDAPATGATTTAEAGLVAKAVSRRATSLSKERAAAEGGSGGDGAALDALAADAW